MNHYPANKENVTTPPEHEHGAEHNSSFSPALLLNLEQVIQEEILILKGLGPGFLDQVKTLEELQDRFVEGRFHLAVLGQFKRGKSTLLNALLGEEVLPSSVTPLTAIPTLVRFGEERKIVISYLDGSPRKTLSPSGAEEMNRDLLLYVSEAENPHNMKGVLQVEVAHPSPILDKGVVLIDTPGIGSTFQHNTEMTLKFLSQCDAGLFLISADPPITETEVAFLREVKKHVPKLFFVMNKVDYLDGKELIQAIAFFKKVLEQQSGIGQDIPVFPVSAKQGLLARQSKNESLWDTSGLSEISDHLINFLANEKDRVLRDVIARRVMDLLAEVLLRLQLKIKTLELPIGDLEQRLSLFNEKIRQAEIQRLHAGDILTGDRKRVVVLLEDQADELRSRASSHFSEIATTAMSVEGSEALALEAIAREIPAYFEAHLNGVTQMIDREITATLKTHQETADSLITLVSRAAAEIFEIPYHAPESEHAYHLTRHPFWVESSWASSFTPVPEELLDRALPKSIREKRKWDRIRRQIEEIVTRNVENLRWYTLQSIDTTFRKFGHELDENLAKTIDATRGAIDEAYRLRKEHADSIAESKERFRKGVEEISSVVGKYEG